MAAVPAALAAQVGSTTDIVTGKVVGAGSQPVAGAQVTVTSLETGVSRSRTTNDKGTYTVLFPDGGGRYRIVVRAIGQQPRTITVQREGDEDRLVANVSLAQASTTLAGVRVTARAPTTGGQRQEPGNSERTVSGEQALRLPVDATDPNALAALTPGVLGQAGNDTTQAGFNVAGQRASQNNVTLDGITFGGASFPQEAVRATRVITNTFDVARGQFSGGQVASTTRSGTNNLYLGGTYTLRAPQLQVTPDYSGAYGTGYTSNQLSAGVGGAFKPDKAFYFVALQGSRRTDPLTSLLGADPRALAGLGASSDSAARFLAALGARGIPATASGIPGTRVNDQATGIARLDFNLSESQTLTLRGDFRYQGQDATRISPFAVPTNGGESANHGGGLFASLSSRFPNEVFGGALLNEGRVYVNRATNNASPYVEIPGGRVRVTSTLADGTTGISSFGFGANAGLPNEGQTNYVEATDELSLLTGDGQHRIKLGGLLNASRFAQQTSTSPYGTYTYNTLADFLANTPALYQRTLAAADVHGGALNLNGYLGDTWRQSRNFQLTYGVRVEGTAYSGAPGYNRGVDSAFGLRTDRFPGEFRASPRVGFTYTFFPDSAKQAAAQQRQAAGGAPSLFRGGPTLFVRGGIGEFRGRAPTQLFSAAQQGSGLPGGQTQLVCLDPVGPDYAAILAEGVSAIPTTCDPRAGAPAATVLTSGGVPTVTAFAPDFRSPRSVRAALGVTRRFWQSWTAGVDASYAWGVAQYGVSDANLNTTPRFALAEEANRPVYAPAAAISPLTGATALAASRLDPAYGQVFAVGSGLRSRNAQVTASLGGFTSRGAIFNLSWTIARNRDQSSYAFGPPAFGYQQTVTGGNPNVLAFAAADQDVRHNIIGTATFPLNASFEVTGIGRLTSGSPYTPTVNGDVNGDGARNDAAFVFNPATVADTALAAGMRRVLADAPSAARNCLMSQMGQVAARNSCRGPWVPGLDLQFNYKPDRLGLQRRLTISATLLNTLAGLDQLFHGADNLRGWGQTVRPDQTLLAITGFNPATQAYAYTVNQRFGNTVGQAAVFRQTFQLGIQARYVYGANPFGAFGFGGGGPGGGGGGGGGGGLLAGLLGGASGSGNAPSTSLAASLNPAAKLIDLRDSLGLDSAQVTKLSVVRDTLAAQYQRFRTDLRAKVQKLGNNADPAVIFSTIRPDLARGRQLLQDAVQQSQAILTPAQWAKVGDDVKNPFRQAFGGPPGGGGRP
ncbi:hypothetical protein tb265_18650 [Gemmatimonadetes bacterium T265]|nr:hypothetical protein tb265_18650 [Gemmatimonadetes bacterium T265]